jgi:pimeloyl-ACP methyl ester carboxylesterase
VTFAAPRAPRHGGRITEKRGNEMNTQWLEREQGRLAYSDAGQGPLVVCVPGLGDLRQEYRFLAPALIDAGFRVASLDLRSHGESSTGWRDLSAEAIGDDVLALIDHLDTGRALVVGTSMGAAAAVWAAANAPTTISGLVLIGPFVRDVGSPAQRRLYRALFHVMLAKPWGLAVWMRYWSSLFPTRRPPDFDVYAARLRRNLGEPERFAALRGMMLGPSRRAIEARMADVSAPAVVVMGSLDRDFKDPAAEATLVAGRLDGDVAMIEGAGHYPHVDYPERTAQIVVDFCDATTEPEPRSPDGRTPHRLFRPPRRARSTS